MGLHRIEISMVGGHGCDREAKEGEPLKGCGQDSCPDCSARAFVEKFKALGAFNYPGEASATFTHWPGKPEEVVDDLLDGTRKKGHF
jgi:hypothetical protein